MSEHPDVDDIDTLHELVNSYWRTHVVYAACVLGLPDLLADGPVEVDAVAARAGADADALRRLLRAMDALGLASTAGDDRWQATPLGRGLRTGAPGGAGERAIVTGRLFAPMWNDLPEAVRAGRAPQAAGVFARIGAEPGLGALFDGLMDAQTSRAAERLDAVLDLGTARTVVDVGGGSGAMVRRLLTGRPELRGIVLDLAGVAERTHAALATTPLAERCVAIGGDFFSEVPSGGDVYLLSFILHDWDDERCLAILRACRRAMHPDARLVVFEQLLAEGPPADPATAYYDLHMLMVTGGRERTESQYRTLLVAAGFRHTATSAADGGRYVIEARPDGVSPDALDALGVHQV